MSGGRWCHGLPHPMADVSPWGDVVAAATAAVQRITEKGEQVVLVSAAGAVRLMHPQAEATPDVIRRHPAWVAGQFDARATADDVREAMVHAYNKSLRLLQTPWGETP